MTKTITLDLDAYEKLKGAKRGKESFSSVVKRAILPEPQMSGREIIQYYDEISPLISDEMLDSVELAVKEQRKQLPTNPWDE